MKLIFRKKGKLLVPEFEHGRILLKEAETNDGTMKRAELYVIPRLADEKAMAWQVSSFDDSMLCVSLGDMSVKSIISNPEIAEFNIGIKPKERSKGYGTVLMNAGAKYCRDIGIEKIRGSLLKDDNIDRRVGFYKSLGMNAELDKEGVTIANINEPDLNAITFTTNPTAEEIWNSTTIR